jgi:cholesterol oxidase
VIAGSPEQGVVDERQRVFGYRNMYICDGSVLAANLGVNPSLTITALAERAMSLIPSARETVWNDAAPSAATRLA